MKLLKPLLLVGSLLLSSAIWAEGGAARTLEHIEKMRDKAEAALTQVEKVPACGRSASMKGHMNMLDEIMTQLHKEHPAPGMSPEEHATWMEQHDKLMDDVLGQMMRQHKLMMTEMKCRK